MALDFLKTQNENILVCTCLQPHTQNKYFPLLIGEKRLFGGWNHFAAHTTDPVLVLNLTDFHKSFELFFTKLLI